MTMEQVFWAPIGNRPYSITNYKNNVSQENPESVLQLLNKSLGPLGANQ